MFNIFGCHFLTGEDNNKIKALKGRVYKGLIIYYTTHVYFENLEIQTYDPQFWVLPGCLH